MGKRTNIMLVMGLIGLALLASDLFRKLDGLLRPVASIEITEMKQENETHVLVWGKLTRYRDCDPQGIRPWLISPVLKTRALADYEFLERAKTRELGDDGFGPWRIQLTKDQLENRAVIESVHSCPLFSVGGFRVYAPFDTITVIYSTEE